MKFPIEVFRAALQATQFCFIDLREKVSKVEEK